MSKRHGASGLAGRNDRPGPWSLSFPSGPLRALPVCGQFFRSSYGPRPVWLFGPRPRAQYFPVLPFGSEMASREGLAESCTRGSGTGETLMAITRHVGSLAVPVLQCVRSRQFAGVPGPWGGHWVRVAPSVAAAVSAPAATATVATSLEVCRVSS